MGLVSRDIAKMIDHSLLHPSFSREVHEEGIEIGLRHDVASICIVPYMLRHCAERLKGSDVAPSTVIGFPHGACTTAAKAFEAKTALAEGAVELDMVVNISGVLSEDWEFVAKDIKAVLEPTHGAGAKLKVIFENCYLEDSHKIRLCEICGELGVDWVKTSTGYGTGGATEADVALMRKYSPSAVQVKAAGGIRDLDAALRMRELGCTRFGCTRTVDVLEAAKARFGA